MTQVLLVGVGGGLGSVARFLLTGWVVATAGATFPWGTLAVNVIGSFFLALIAQLGLAGSWISDDARLLLTTGMMGGFTTFSTFSLETSQLFNAGSLGLGVANVALNVFGCLAATGLGLLTARWLIT